MTDPFIYEITKPRTIPVWCDIQWFQFSPWPSHQPIDITDRKHHDKLAKDPVYRREHSDQQRERKKALADKLAKKLARNKLRHTALF